VNLFLFSILVVFLLVALGVVEINFFGKEGFNNRDKIWSFYLFEALASPLMGYGTEQLAVKTMSSYAEYQHRMGLSFVLGSAHNGFIEIFYSLGLLGLGLFLYILRKMYNFSHVSDSSISFLGYCFFVLFVATNFFESRTYGVNLPFIFLIYFYYLNMTYRRTKYSLPEIVVKGR
jgi:O-antigen ligase